MLGGAGHACQGAAEAAAGRDGHWGSVHHQLLESVPEYGEPGNVLPPDDQPDDLQAEALTSPPLT